MMEEFLLKEQCNGLQAGGCAFLRGGDSYGTSAQIRSTEPQSGEVDLIACPMERAAPQMPLFHCLGQALFLYAFSKKQHEKSFIQLIYFFKTFNFFNLAPSFSRVCNRSELERFH